MWWFAFLYAFLFSFLYAFPPIVADWKSDASGPATNLASISTTELLAHLLKLNVD
jgi:hypothetical protein